MNMPMPPRPTAAPPSGGAQPPMQNGGFMPPGLGAGAPPQSGPAQMGGPQMPSFITNPTLPPEAVASVNPTVQEVLWRRMDRLGPDAVAALDQAITPENYLVFLAIFPELEPLIMEASALDDSGGADAGGGMPPMQMPPGPATPMPQAGQQGMQPMAPMPPAPGGGSKLNQMKFGR